MIPEKIRIDMPLPTPRSVMSSPSHISSAIPATRVKVIRMPLAQVMPGRTGCELELVAWLKETMRLADSTIASTSVMYRVIWVIFLRPISPSSCHSLILGMTAESSSMMMEAVM